MRMLRGMTATAAGPDSVCQLSECYPTPMAMENRLAPVATAHDVVNRAGIFDAHAAGHGTRFRNSADHVNTHFAHMHGLTPFLTPFLVQ
jgi:hypothetical protein